MNKTREKYALKALLSYLDDYEEDTDYRIVMAIRILEGDPDALNEIQKHQPVRPWISKKIEENAS